MVFSLGTYTLIFGEFEGLTLGFAKACVCVAPNVQKLWKQTGWISNQARVKTNVSCARIGIEQATKLITTAFTNGSGVSNVAPMR